MNFVVRPAVADDIPWILRELSQFDQFYGASHSLMPSPNFAVERLRVFIEDTVHFLFLLVVHQEPGHAQPVGMLLSTFYAHLFNPEVSVCAELLWWVQPKVRGTVAGAILLDTWLTLVTSRSEWQILTLVERETHVHTRALSRRGFHVKEHNYVRES